MNMRMQQQTSLLLRCCCCCMLRPLLIGHENVDTKTPKKRNGCPLFRFRSGHFRVHNFFDLSPYRTRKIKVEFCQETVRRNHASLLFRCVSKKALLRKNSKWWWVHYSSAGVIQPFRFFGVFVSWVFVSCRHENLPEFSCREDTKTQDTKILGRIFVLWVL